MEAPTGDDTKEPVAKNKPRVLLEETPRKPKVFSKLRQKSKWKE